MIYVAIHEAIKVKKFQASPSMLFDSSVLSILMN